MKAILGGYIVPSDSVSGYDASEAVTFFVSDAKYESFRSRKTDGKFRVELARDR